MKEFYGPDQIRQESCRSGTGPNWFSFGANMTISWSNLLRMGSNLFQMCPDLVHLELDLVNVDVNNPHLHLAVYSDNIKRLTKDFRLKSLGTNVYNFNWSKDYPKMDQETEYTGLAS